MNDFPVLYHLSKDGYTVSFCVNSNIVTIIIMHVEQVTSAATRTERMKSIQVRCGDEWLTIHSGTTEKGAARRLWETLVSNGFCPKR